MSPRVTSLKRKSSSFSNGPAKVRKSIVEPDEPLPIIQQVPGTVLVFGEGIAGQLGLGEDDLEKGKPTPVPDLTNIVDIAAGGMHTVCLTSEQEVLTFGCNDEGALGRDTSVEGSEYVPGKVEIPSSSGAKVVQISAGDCHTAALLDDGSVYMWGEFRDNSGTMGLVTKGQREKEPVLVGVEVKVVKIASGSNHLVMLGKDDNLYSCGCAEQGQLGRVAERSSSRGSRSGIAPLLQPAVITLRKKLKISDIWTGGFCTFAKEKSSGDIYASGLNNYKQIGLDDLRAYFNPSFSKPFSQIQWSKISGGLHHTAAMDIGGSVYTSGRRDYGRLGLGQDCPDAEKPTLVTSISNKKCIDISSGTTVTFAVIEDGTLYSWGMGSPQLGLGKEEDVHVPTQVTSRHLENKKVVKVSSGGQHTVILATSIS